MSAYIIDDETYSALYYYLKKQEYYHCHTYPHGAKDHRILNLIVELRAANYHSVNVRYREKKETPAFDLQLDSELTMSDIQAFKTMQSINYQSCEFDEWPETKAWVGLQEALAYSGYRVISKMKEYNEAIWS